MPAPNDDHVARLVLQAGLATPEQLADARKLVEQMRTLGVERDLLGALVDRQVIDQATADQVRARAAAAPEVLDAEILDAEVVDGAGAEDEPEDELKVAPDYGSGAPVGAAASGAAPSSAFCCNHADKQAVAFCTHCSRPLCVHCVIRTERGTFCSEACAVGAGSASEAVVGMSHKSYEKAVQIGAYVRWAVILAILVGMVLAVKWVVDDYRVSFALQKAKNKGDTTKEGMDALKRATRLRPRRVDLRVRLGRAHLRAGDAGLAVKQLEAAIEHDPRSSDALLAVADAYIAKGKYGKAAKALLELRVIGAADSDSERRLGGIYRDRLGNPSGAVDAFRRALKVGSDSRELHFEVGTACYAEGNLGEAKEELLKAVEPLGNRKSSASTADRTFLADDEKMSKAYSLLADVAEKEGDTDGLGELLAHAQAAAPGSTDIVLRRARLLVGRGDPAEALAALTQSRGQLSGNIEYLELLAGLQAETGAVKEALATQRILYGKAPDRPGVIERLAGLEASSGKAETAAKLLELLPPERRESDELLNVWEVLTRNQLSRGRAASALRMLEGLGARVESDTRFAPLWCDVLHRLGRDAEALKRAELALRRDPKNPTPHLVVASVLRSLGRTREAMERIRAASDLGAKGEADLELGLLCWQGGFKNEASRRFAKAMADPKLSPARQEEAKGYLARMRGSEAKKSYPSYVIEFLHGKLELRATNTVRAVASLHVATYGAKRVYGMLAGTVGPEPFEGELAEIRRRAPGQRERADDRSLAALQAESDKMVEAASRALKAVYPRAATDIGKEMGEYRMHLRSAGDDADKLAASATAHAMMLAAGLRHHPRAAETGPVVECAMKKMEARKALAPGPLQEAISADLAAVDLIAAATGSGPGSFIYKAAVEEVLSKVAADDAEAADPLTQFSATRAAVFRMLWLFTAQTQEMGSVFEDGAGAKGGAQ